MPHKCHLYKKVAFLFVHRFIPMLARRSKHTLSDMGVGFRAVATKQSPSTVERRDNPGLQGRNRYKNVEQMDWNWTTEK